MAVAATWAAIATDGELAPLAFTVIACVFGALALVIGLVGITVLRSKR